jgi:hypothetical protein
MSDETAWGQYQPREPKFYESKLPLTGCDIPMPPIKSVRDQMCKFCAKEDVCNIKEESTKAYKDILEIEGRTNVFINTTVNCKKFLRKLPVSNIR